MKRMLSLLMTLLMLFCCSAALADTPVLVLNDSELAMLKTQYTDYTIVSAYRCDEANLMVSLHKTQGRNLLVWLRNGSVAYAGTAAIPQGYPVYVGKDTICSASAHQLHFSAVQAISESSETTNNKSTACHYYADEHGDFRLAVYRVNGTVIHVQSNGLTFDGTTVSGMIENRMQHIKLSNMPKTLASARKQLSNAPEIPTGTLSASCMEFTAGQVYAVYAAPDSNAVRGANGKAKVSTNDWVQVFGRDGKWLMVQYDISSEHFRIGYIPVSALPAGLSAPELSFTGTAAVTAYAVTVTDDPLNSQAALLELPAETKVLSLGTMGTWSYIEGVWEGKSYRGFVPTESLSGSNVVSSIVEARTILEGSWTVYAGGADNADTLTFSADGTLHGHFLTNPQDGISTLQYIAGSERLVDWDGQWSLSTYDLNRQTYWNDLEFELTITRDGIPKQYGLRICLEPYSTAGSGYALILSDSEHSSGLVLCK